MVVYCLLLVPLVVVCRFFIVGGWFSDVGRCFLLAVVRWLRSVGYVWCWLVFVCCELVVGYWFFVVGCWFLFVGSWLLVVGRFSFLVGRGLTLVGVSVVGV